MSPVTPDAYGLPAGPPEALSRWLHAEQYTYALPPGYSSNEQHAPDLAAFEAQYIQDYAPIRPSFKRAPSSTESMRQAAPEQKRHRMSLLHMDSGSSSHANASTATSNDSSGSNPASPLPEFGADSPPATDHINKSALPALWPAKGVTPSVLLPANAQEAMRRSYAQSIAQHARRQSAEAAAEQAARAPHSARKSKATALQHMEEVVDDDEDSVDAEALVARHASAKRTGRKKGGRAAPAVVEKMDDDDVKSLDGDEDKRAQFLERNRVAACKSRQKKKEWIKNLEVASDDLTRQNGDLQVLVSALRDEIGSLRSALAAHAQCSSRAGAHHSLSASMPASLSAQMAPSDMRPQDPRAHHQAAYVGQSQLQSQWSPSSHPHREPAVSPRMAMSASGVIDIHGARQASGMTPYLQGQGSEQDYFGQSFVYPVRNELNTPELARSLGYAP